MSHYGEDEFAGTDVRNSSSLAGVPDEYQRLWTPHRLVYIQQGQQPHPDDCPFCLAPAMTDEEGLIVHRGKTAFVLLNLYPYNSGHLLVCPYRHIATYDEATDEEVAEIGRLTQVAMRVLRSVSRNDGFPIIAKTKAVTALLGDVRKSVADAWPQDSSAPSHLDTEE
jgi:ATP adenylyltransferase